MVTMVTMTNLNIFHPTCTTTHSKNFPTKFRYNRTNNFLFKLSWLPCQRRPSSRVAENIIIILIIITTIIVIIIIIIINGAKIMSIQTVLGESQLTLPHVRNLICKLYQVVNLWRLPINAVLACKYIGQSK